MNSNDASHGHDLSIAILVDQSPQEVFAAITDVRGWWSEGLEGESARPGDVFTYRHEDVHHSTHRSTHRVTEAVAGQRVVWHTVDAELTHSARPSEWTGTDVRFDIARRGDKTEVRFTHLGLVPEFDCFEACSRGWAYYVGVSLRKLITTGEGKPDRSSPLGRVAALAGMDHERT